MGAEMADLPERLPNHPEWDAFSRRHTGCSFLECDPLYALSEELIDSIKQHVPGFFNNEQERFERDLAGTASFGFFLRQPLGTNPGLQRELDERQQRTSREIHCLLAEELRRAGVDQQDIGEYFERGTDQRERVVSRQAAYVGWLILNQDYHREVRAFRERWQGTTHIASRFPRLPIWLMPDHTEEDDLPPGFRDECYRFFVRWGLDTLLTWDWPVPMEPDLNVGLRRNTGLLSSGGMVLFVPWYLVRGGKLHFEEVVHQSRLGAVPDHLRDWVNKQGERKGDAFGDTRYATVQWLYRYYVLVLTRRYADACEGNRQRLDRAFASIIKRDEDTTKKLRCELQKALTDAVSGRPSS